MSSTTEDDRKKQLFLDPEADSEARKKQLADTIETQMVDVDRAEIDAAVDEKYESIMQDAEVKQHVPTLAEGQAKTVLRDRKKDV